MGQTLGSSAKDRMRFLVVLACVAVALGEKLPSPPQQYLPPVAQQPGLQPSSNPAAPLGVQGGLSPQVPQCNPRTQLVTSLVFNTRTAVIPNTIEQLVTKWLVATSTVFETQVVTSYPAAVVLTETETLVGTNYVTRNPVLTETVYNTQQRSVAVTDTAVLTTTITQTYPSTIYDTFITTFYSTNIQYHTDTVTTTQYKYLTSTARLPVYRTQTVTSRYPVYETTTRFITSNEYITNTELIYTTTMHTKCSQQPSVYGY